MFSFTDGALLVTGAAVLLAAVALLWMVLARKAADTTRAIADATEARNEVQERLAYLVEASPVVVFSAQACGHFCITYISANVRARLGYEPSDFTKYPSFWIDHVHPDDRARALLDLAGLEELEDRSSEYRFRREDGSYRWLRSEMRLARETEGGPLHVVGSMFDITGRRRAEERFQRLVESAPDAMVVSNAVGAIVLVNGESERLFGYPRDELLGTPVERLIPEQFRGVRQPGSAEASSGLQRSDEVGCYEVDVLRKDGCEVPAEVSSRLVRTEDGVLVVTTIRDITKRKRAEAELARLAGFPDSNPEPVLECDRGGRITYYNDAARREFPEETAARALPPELSRLVERCLDDGENILGHEASMAEKTLLWTLHPIEDRQRVQLYATDVSELKSTELALRASEAEYRTLVQRAPFGIYCSSPEGRFLSANPVFVEMLGYSTEEEVLALDMAEDVYITREDRRQLVDLADTQRDADNALPSFTVRWKRRDGTSVLVRLAGRAIADGMGEVAGFEMFAEDVTQQEMVEERLRQSQRLEALGLLAGGVAHDFNNILSVIILEAQLGIRGLEHDDPQRARFGEIKLAGERAAELTGQLLSFSRKQVIKTVAMNLNDVVTGLRKMLGRLISEDIELSTALEESLPMIAADKGQLEQILTNLVVNARDAMPSGGNLEVRTSIMTPAAELRTACPGLTAGPQVVLEVQDTGSGIPDDVKAKMFDPFFTTKQPGKGTGFGLATVYGSVKKMNGYIDVESEVGVGTTVRIYFPVVDESEAAPSASDVDARIYDATGEEVVMVAEDDPQLRRIVIQMLREQGYTVISAIDGAHAIERLEAHDGPVHLLLTDVVMPQMGGLALAAAVEERWPEIRVVFMSGYTSDGDLQEKLATERSSFLRKPFSAESLGTTVRQALANGGGAHDAESGVAARPTYLKAL